MPFPRRRWIGRALRLDSRERAEALRAAAWLAACGLAVRLVPVATILHWADRLPSRPSARGALTPRACATAIERAARVLHIERCLPLAVAASCLLRRSGHHPTLEFGVALDADAGLLAHAWVSCDGLIVIGGPVADRYVPLARAGRRSA